jgi:putative colanic acid biosynthesis acetyltransferase WcaF
MSAPYLGQGCISPYGKRELLHREIWAVVQSTLFRWSPRSWHGFRARLLKLFGANIPECGQVVIFPTVEIIFPWKLTLEPRSMVGPRVRLYNLGGITIKYGANISQDCHLCAGTHDYNRWDMPVQAKPIVIGTNVWVCAEVFVGPGVTVGELSVIGARSVVTKDQPAKMICAGHPCQPLRPRQDPT